MHCASTSRGSNSVHFCSDSTTGSLRTFCSIHRGGVVPHWLFLASVRQTECSRDFCERGNTTQAIIDGHYRTLELSEAFLVRCGCSLATMPNGVPRKLNLANVTNSYSHPSGFWCSIHCHGDGNAGTLIFPAHACAEEALLRKDSLTAIVNVTVHF